MDWFALSPVINWRPELGTESALAMGSSVAWVRAGEKLALLTGSLLRSTIMATKSIPVVRKKRGRPATGQDPVSAIRLSLPLRTAIDNWANQQPDKPSRSEAIRRLIDIALASKTKRQRTAPATFDTPPASTLSTGE